MLSSSIKRQRDFMTLWCIASCLIRWLHFRRFKSFVAFLCLQVAGHWKQHFWHNCGIFLYPGTAISGSSLYASSSSSEVLLSSSSSCSFLGSSSSCSYSGSSSTSSSCTGSSLVFLPRKQRYLFREYASRQPLPKTGCFKWAESIKLIF